VLLLRNKQIRKIDEFTKQLKEKLGITIFEEDDIIKLNIIKEYVNANFGSLDEISYFIASNNISL
jgi:hypothetical protein